MQLVNTYGIIHMSRHAASEKRLSSMMGGYTDAKTRLAHNSPTGHEEVLMTILSQISDFHSHTSSQMKTLQ
jgi:hypothetical protein